MEDPLLLEGTCVERKDYNNNRATKNYNKKEIEQQEIFNIIDGRVAYIAATLGICDEFLKINYYGEQTKIGSFAIVHAKNKHCHVYITGELLQGLNIEQPVIVPSIITEDKIEKIQLKNGNTRFAIKIPLYQGHWFWKVPRARRPQFVTVNKIDKKLFVLILGINSKEVTDNFKVFKELEQDLENDGKSRRRIRRRPRKQ